MFGLVERTHDVSRPGTESGQGQTCSEEESLCAHLDEKLNLILKAKGMDITQVSDMIRFYISKIFLSLLAGGIQGLKTRDDLGW